MSGERLVWPWLIGLAGLVALLVVLSDILMPFVAGMAVAYFLDPLADRLEKWGASRTVASGLILAAFFACALALAVLLFPLLADQVVGLIARAPGYLEALRGKAGPLLERLHDSLGAEQVEALRDAAGSYAGAALRWVGGLLEGLWSGGMALFQVLSLVVITPLVAFYLLRDWDRVVERLDGLLPRTSADVVRGQVAEIDKTLAGFARGQAIVCLVIGIFYGVGLTLVGLQSGFIIGLGTGLISFVPYFGMLVGLTVGLGMALAQFSEWLPIVLVGAVFGVGQVIEGNFLTPKLVGGRVGLHPVWIIFALLAGGTLFGFTGVLLAVPAAAVIGVVVRFAVKRYLESRLYRGQGPEA